MTTGPGESLGRILLVTKTDFADPRDGGTLRVSAIESCLRAAGLDVDSVAIRTSNGKRHMVGQRTTWRTLRNRNWWRATMLLAASTARVGSVTVARWSSPAAAERIADQIGSHHYNAVLIGYSQLLPYRSLFGELPVVMDMHNVEYELLANFAESTESGWRRLVASYETSRVRKLEMRAGSLTDAISTVSDHDADLIRRISGASSVVTAPNGVSDQAFEVERPHTSVTGPAVFIGHLGWQPNVDAAQWLVRSVWPHVRHRRPTAELQLIGKSPAKSVLAYDGVDGISVHPDVPSTLPYLRDAAVATAPLLAAGGTRLKILEAMATGTPVVATSLGAMGLDHLADDGAMLITDDPEDFAQAVVRYLDSGSDPEFVRRQVDSYRWRLALRPLVDLVLEAAAGRRS